MIGYYVHHHGHGHLHRALSLARATDEPVVGLSSLAEPAGAAFAGWVPLADDPALGEPADPSGGTALHWAPTNSTGYATRMAELAAWVASARPRLVVVDVSVEVAAFVRLLGVPVAVVTLPGDRVDDAHRLAYRLASSIVAPWPQAVHDPAHLRPYADKLVFTGAVSRFDDQMVRTAPHAGRALLLLGSGGSSVPSIPTADGSWHWTTLGGRDGAWSDDVWGALQDADVVVTHAGLNALAEVAAARRPAIVVPQERPFDEQRVTGGALRAEGLATVLDAWPEASAWPGLLDAAVTAGQSWSRWNDGRGAARFAAALQDLRSPAVADAS